jgi:hypothetical protein
MPRGSKDSRAENISPGAFLREEKKNTYKVSSLDKTEKEPHSHKTPVRLDTGGGSGNNTPDRHGSGQVNGRFAHLVEEQIGRDWTGVKKRYKNGTAKDLL